MACSCFSRTVNEGVLQNKRYPAQLLKRNTVTRKQISRKSRQGVDKIIDPPHKISLFPRTPSKFFLQRFAKKLESVDRENGFRARRINSRKSRSRDKDVDGGGSIILSTLRESSPYFSFDFTGWLPARQLVDIISSKNVYLFCITVTTALCLRNRKL